MLKTGLCSITFRKLSCFQIVDLVRKAGLHAIEWGGDIHVPPGNIAVAQDALRLTTEAGLNVSSYGSYYNVLDANGNKSDFSPVLESALALGTDTIRIWSGAQPSEIASESYRQTFIQTLRANLDVAASQGIRLALEFHVNSLNDSNASALALLEEVGHPNLYTYWQPMYWVADADYRFQGLEQLAGHVLNLHVFHWLFHPYKGGWSDNVERRPLHESAEDWTRYLAVELPRGTHHALLEFVADDDPEKFLQDAETSKNWVSK